MLILPSCSPGHIIAYAEKNVTTGQQLLPQSKPTVLHHWTSIRHLRHVRICIYHRSHQPIIAYYDGTLSNSEKLALKYCFLSDFH